MEILLGFAKLRTLIKELKKILIMKIIEHKNGHG